MATWIHDASGQAGCRMISKQSQTEIPVNAALTTNQQLADGRNPLGQGLASSFPRFVKMFQELRNFG
jgi:hypothetical protein